MAHDVFISYATKNRSTADEVCQFLEARKISCWYAPRDVLPGTEWGAALVEAIESSRVMVLVFSAASNESANVRREIERAVSNLVTIIPMRIENVLPGKALDYFLSSQHWLDAMSSPLSQQDLERLADSISQHLQRQLDAGEESPDTTLASHVASPAVPVPRESSRLRWAIAVASLFFLIFVLSRFTTDTDPATPMEAARTQYPESTDSDYEILSSIHEGNTVAYVEKLVGVPQLSRVIDEDLTANYVKNSSYLLTFFYKGLSVAGFTVISTEDGFSPGVDLGMGDEMKLGEFSFAEASGSPKTMSAISGRSIRYYVEALESSPTRRFVDVFLGSIVYGAGGAAAEIDRVADAELGEHASELADALHALRANGKPNLYGEGRISIAQLEASLLTHAEYENFFGSN